MSIAIDCKTCNKLCLCLYLCVSVSSVSPEALTELIYLKCLELYGHITAGPKSVARTMDAANCAAVLLSMPISYHFHSAIIYGRARRRKWRYIKYTPLPLPFYIRQMLFLKALLLIYVQPCRTIQCFNEYCK